MTPLLSGERGRGDKDFVANIVSVDLIIYDIKVVDRVIDLVSSTNFIHLTYSLTYLWRPVFLPSLILGR